MCKFHVLFNRLTVNHVLNSSPLDNLCSNKLSISDNNYIIKELKKINKHKPKDLKMWKERLIKKEVKRWNPMSRTTWTQPV